MFDKLYRKLTSMSLMDMVPAIGRGFSNLTYKFQWLTGLLVVSLVLYIILVIVNVAKNGKSLKVCNAWDISTIFTKEKFDDTGYSPAWWGNAGGADGSMNGLVNPKSVLHGSLGPASTNSIGLPSCPSGSVPATYRDPASGANNTVCMPLSQLRPMAWQENALKQCGQAWSTEAKQEASGFRTVGGLLSASHGEKALADAMYDGLDHSEFLKVTEDRDATLSS